MRGSATSCQSLAGMRGRGYDCIMTYTTMLDIMTAQIKNRLDLKERVVEEIGLRNKVRMLYMAVSNARAMDDDELAADIVFKPSARAMGALIANLVPDVDPHHDPIDPAKVGDLLIEVIGDFFND